LTKIRRSIDARSGSCLTMGSERCDLPGATGPADSSPSRRSWRIWRRVGSASARNTDASSSPGRPLRPRRSR